MQIRKRSLAFLAFFILSFITKDVASSQEHKVFSSKEKTSKFNRVVVDKLEGNVFIGAVNQLYQLSPDLEKITSVTTGPKPDSSGKLTNNYNKVLIIDYVNSRLISCGSNSQGICEVYDRKDIKNKMSTVIEPVIADDENASSVAFIAYPKSQETPSVPTLYVGVAYSGNLLSRSKVPVIATRSLDNDTLFKIIKRDTISGTSISVNPLFRDTYTVNYIYGFNSGPCNYFITTQKNSTMGFFSYITKLVRICDKIFNLYAEIPIQCTDKQNRIYNLAQAGFFGKPGSDLVDALDIESQDNVLFLIFTQSKQSEGNGFGKPNAHSVLCVFSLNTINYKFIQNMQNCMAGKGYRVLESVPPDQPCVKRGDAPFDLDSCWANMNISFSGENPVQKRALFVFDTILTTITATSVNQFTVVFIGTNTGHLKKIAIKDLLTVEQYAVEATEEESRVNSIQLDRQEEHLYVLTDNHLRKIKVHNCHDYQTDFDCLEVKDPYCGWCIHENKCTLRDGCDDVKNNSLLWIPYDFRAQLSIIRIDPESFPITYFKNVTIKAQNIPPFNEDFICMFIFNHKQSFNGTWNKDLVTNGTLISDNTVHCLPPDLKLLPWTSKTPEISVTLSIKTTNITIVVSKKYKFYDCTMSTSCSSCTKRSKFQCNWHVMEHSCVYNSTHNCKNGVSDSNVVCNNKHCPTISIINDGSSEMLIPDGFHKNIRAKIYNLHQFDPAISHTCKFTIEDKVKFVKALLRSNVISCEETDFNYSLKVPNITVTFAVIRNNYEEPVGTPDGTLIVIYKCTHMANTCKACLDLDKKYGCGWCESSNQCEIETQCDTDAPSHFWLGHDELCSNSSILYFKPKLGPYEGGINITIRNNELYCPFRQNTDTITVSGTSCEPINDSCIANESIICCMRETRMPHTNITQGPVIVRIRGFNITSETNYTLVNPKIHNFSPEHGPQTGGTELTIRGEYMNASNSVEVFINDLPCMVFFKSFAIVKCLTIATRWKIRGYVNVKFSATSQIIDKNFYQYTSADDSSIESNNAFIPQGTPEGGNHILLHDENLRLISKATIRISSQLNQKNQTNFYDGECNILNDTFMNCISPPMPGIKNCSNDCNAMEFPKLLQYNFVLVDFNGTKVPILKKKYPKFFLYCVPMYNSSWIRNYCIEIIPGNSSLFRKTVYCAVVIILLFVILVLLFLKRRMRNTKVLEKMQRELDRLELCVAAECKEAFAELQTEISDSRISGMPDSLPFWDYRTYVLKTLFPNIHDHSFILCDKPELMGKGKQLQSFHHLITNKTFLILFIKTLESFESFSMNDRVYVASMLMISLQNEMEYCTDIIKTLLESLIEKSLRGTCHPKLLLRQTESIVEKMLSSWLSFLLYKFLLECAGKPLFTLFKGIKQRVNRGPIDEITSEARYSLSEEKLIRQHIDYCSLTVYVNVSQETACSTGLESAVENVSIKMLDCDTISQAKEKAVSSIYFAVNYSKRPKPWELNLILVSDSSDGKVLYDIDSSSEIEGEWKKRNTLHHYRITDGSKLNLELVKQTSHYYKSSISFTEEQRVFSCEALKTTIIECATPKMNRAKYRMVPDSDAYYKEWHLVKPNYKDIHHVYQDGSNMMSEIYLTRLLSTKCTLQKFVDDLFEVILSKTRQRNCFPIAIKYMFDFLDDQASKHVITDPEVVHTWKNNCLPLRFWVNIIKNPDFIFDIHKSDIISSCLSVVAQAFMDSCSIGKHCLGKDSPTSKLLYAKDIPFYTEWVMMYYTDIKVMPSVSRECMNAVLAKESQLHCMDFNTNTAIYELYKYAVKYKDRLMLVLRADESSQSFNLAEKLNQILQNMTTDLNSV